MGSAHSHARRPLRRTRRGDSSDTHQSRPHSARPLAIAVALTLGFALVELFAGLVVRFAGPPGAMPVTLATYSAATAVLRSQRTSLPARVTDRHSYGWHASSDRAAFVIPLQCGRVVAWIFYEAI